MLLYGAARDPATCKPTKDSEIAAARLRPALVLSLRLSRMSSTTTTLSSSHPAARSRSFSLSSSLSLSLCRRSENTAGQYRNVFTAILSRRQNLARSSGKIGSRGSRRRDPRSTSTLSGRASFSGFSGSSSPIAIACPAYRVKLGGRGDRSEATVEYVHVCVSFSLSFFLPPSREAELACLPSMIDFPRRRADGEEKDCPSGAWIELLTIGLLCRGAFQPAAIQSVCR